MNISTSILLLSQFTMVLGGLVAVVAVLVALGPAVHHALAAARRVAPTLQTNTNHQPTDQTTKQPTNQPTDSTDNLHSVPSAAGG